MYPTISNRQLLLRITLLLLLLSIMIGLGLSYYLKHMAFESLAKQDTDKTSHFIFEVMYTKMEEGWSRDDLKTVIEHLNGVYPGMNIRSYRTEQTAALFGEDPAASEALASDPNIRRAAKGEKVLLIHDDDSVQYFYPVRSEAKCLHCHTNSRIGEVNGVLDLHFPAQQISIPLHMIIVYFLIFFVLFLIIIFIIYYVVLNQKIIKPLIRFTDTMERISDGQNLDRRITLNSKITEIRTMEVVFNDMMEQIKYYYDQMLNRLFIDPLTDLPNLQALKRDLVEYDDPALILINLNQFKDINEFYGHVVGDFLLIEFADRLQTYLQPGDTLYRLGGDEFVWLQHGNVNLYELLDTLETLHAHIYKYNDLTIMLSLRCGIAQGAEHPISKAASALEQAKANNRPLEVYHETGAHKHDTEYNLYWNVKLKEALEEHRLITYYQPILSTHEEKPHKFESLARLVDRDGTVYAPAYFMEAAKHARLHLQLTQAVIRHAFDHFASRPYVFSVNLSVDDILSVPMQDFILNHLSKFPEPQRVIFEILETEEITDFETINDFIKTIKTLGARIAIDDFGSGFSNYSYVLKLHADFLKIDSSLIREIDTDSEAQIIVESIVLSARKLGIKTIAEYVHSATVLEKVKALGVDFVQGYHIGRPREDTPDF